MTYFFVGRKLLVPTLVALFLFWLVTYSLSSVVESRLLGALNTISNALSLKHFGWFAAGAMFYLNFQHQKTKSNTQWFYFAILMMVISSVTVRLDAVGFDVEVIAGALFISALFALSFKSGLLQRLLETRLLLLLGFISYPLYLIHENIMTSIIIKMTYLAPWLHPFLYPYPGILFVIGVAFVISYNLEPRLINLLDFRRYQRLFMRFPGIRNNHIVRS